MQESKPALDLIILSSAPIEQLLLGFEYYHLIYDLFARFDVKPVVLNESLIELDLFIENAVICYGCRGPEISKKASDYINEYNRRGLNFFIVHFGDEWLRNSCRQYKLAKHVFRNYWYKSDFSNVTFIPLGPKKGFFEETESIVSFHDKEFDISFAGEIKFDRQEMLATVNRFKHKFVHITKKWECKTALTDKKLYQIYKKSALVPCPSGTNVDTFRIIEALESGAAPVVKLYGNHSYYDNIFGVNPFLKVSNWVDLIDVGKFIYKEQDKYLHFLNAWYLNFKKELQDKIYDVILANSK